MPRRSFCNSLAACCAVVKAVGKAVAAGCAVVVLVLCAAACGSDDYTYSSFHCNLTIDNSVMQDATLASAMNGMAPGVFCKISYVTASRSYSFSNNQGMSSTKRLGDKDLQRRELGSMVGMNNGLIVGYGNLSSTGNGYAFYAFDAQCPNCFDYNALPLRNYPLAMTSAGVATCANCKREYNMNSGGNCTNNGGKGLTLYRANTTGELGTLAVY